MFGHTTENKMIGERPLSESSILSIFDYDSKVRFITVVDSVGTPLLTRIRDGLKSLEPPELTTKQQVHSVITVCLAEEFDDYFGKTNFIMVNRERLILVFFAVSKDIYVAVSMEPDFPPQKVGGFVEHVRKLFDIQRVR